jgi:hypothetical protein
MKKQSIASLREQVVLQAERELEYCNTEDTPIVCSMCETEEGKKKIIELIVEYVGNSGQTVSQAIVSIEEDSNPKSKIMQ